MDDDEGYDIDAERSKEERRWKRWLLAAWNWTLNPTFPWWPPHLRDQTDESPPSSSSSSNRYRYAFFDNCKFVYILMVVWGHLFTGYWDVNMVTPENRSTLSSSKKFVMVFYYACYSVHMPAFTFISGYFSHKVLNPKSVKTLIDKVFIPYIIFQFVIPYIIVFVDGGEPNVKTPGGDNFQYNFISSAAGYTWYLITLVMWRIGFQMFSVVKRSIWLFIALAFGILAGYDSGLSREMALGRAFSFFPFFVLGNFVKTGSVDIVKKLSETRVRIASGAALSCVYLGYLFWGIYYFDREVFHEIEPYGEDVYQVLWRLFFYAVCTVNIVATMSLIPTRELPYVTEWGKRSMYPFLFHRLFVRLVNLWCGVENDVKTSQTWLYPLLMLFYGALVTCLLSTRIVRWVTWPLVEPYVSFLFDDEPRPTELPPRGVGVGLLGGGGGELETETQRREEQITLCTITATNP